MFIFLVFQFVQSTAKANPVVATDDTATYRAFPLSGFFLQENSHPLLFNHCQVFHHAHLIFGAVPLIKLPYPGTWIPCTLVTKAGCAFFPLFTNNDFARPAIFRLVSVAAAATVTRVFVSQVAAAYGAIHTAGGY